MKLWIFLLVFFASMLGGLAQIYLKKGMTGFTLQNLLTNFSLMIGFTLYGLAFLIYNFSLRFEKVSLLYPIIGFSYLFCMIFAFLILKEPVGLKNIIGSVVLVFGVFLMST